MGLPTALPRLFDLSKAKEEQCLIRVEDVVKHYLHRLFPKDQVEHVAVFRIIRNQNFPVRSARATISCRLCARCSPAAWGAR